MEGLIFLLLSFSLFIILISALVFFWSFLFGLSLKKALGTASPWGIVRSLSGHSRFVGEMFSFMSISFLCNSVQLHSPWAVLLYFGVIEAIRLICLVFYFIRSLFGSSFVVIPCLTFLSLDRGIFPVSEFIIVQGILMFRIKMLWLLSICFLSRTEEYSCFICFSIFQLAISCHGPFFCDSWY